MALAQKYLRILAEEIHSSVVATTDDEGHPVTRAIDIMLADADTFYFLTAKGKAFCDQLQRRPYIAVTGMTGGSTMERKAVSVRGKVSCIGTQKLDQIFLRNPYMAEIYPTEVSRKALVVFKMERGEGEFFDLSTKPITRETFAVGGAEESAEEAPFFITDACIGCGKCVDVCPQQCIDTTKLPFRIEASHCLHCGNCLTDCPVGAVVRRERA